MGARAIHRLLTAAPEATSALDGFDRHVAASILSAAAARAEATGAGFVEETGLSSTDVRAILALAAPLAWSFGAMVGRASHEPAPSAETRALTRLLDETLAPRSALSPHLPALIAHASGRPHHLWQDLGLANRFELNDLMARHFPFLAARNRGMRWKRFFARALCDQADGALCVAPTCGECDEFDACFGAEDGAPSPVPLPHVVRADAPPERRQHP